MDEKPEIVFFAEHKLGGVQNFYYNLVRYSQTHFDIKWILIETENSEDAKPIIPYDFPHKVFIIYKNETLYEYSRRLSELVSDRPGAVVTNFASELFMLHLYRKKNKTVYFICHDELYLDNAERFEFLIDQYIGHNPYFFEELRKRLPGRVNDVHYFPFGIKLPPERRQPNFDKPLRLLFLARLDKKKGIYDLLEIDQRLFQKGIQVQWTVIGNGPERMGFGEEIKANARFRLYTNLNDAEKYSKLPEHDIFVLPSRLDGVPLAMLETMGAGLVPILYRFNPGIGMIFPTEAMIVDPGDINGMAQLIQDFDSNRNLLESYSVACADIIRAKFNLEERNRQYFDFFSGYRLHKKPIRRKTIAYGGLLNNPVVPPFLRNTIRSVRNIFKSGI
jgi:glycosyltransferase involved in cell wall biosynthesis